MQISSALYALSHHLAPASPLLKHRSLVATAGADAMPLAAEPQSPEADAAPSSIQATAKPDPVESFLVYMKKSPAERLEDAWLQSHHLTRQDLAAMSPEKRRALEQQMADEIQTQLKQATANKAAGRMDLLV